MRGSVVASPPRCLFPGARHYGRPPPSSWNSADCSHVSPAPRVTTVAGSSMRSTPGPTDTHHERRVATRHGLVTVDPSTVTSPPTTYLVMGSH